MKRRHRISTLFPYTTLFRSLRRSSPGESVAPHAARRAPAYRVEHCQRGPWRAADEAEASGLTRSSCAQPRRARSEEHTSELQSHVNIVCRLLLEKKKKTARI